MKNRMDMQKNSLAQLSSADTDNAYTEDAYAANVSNAYAGNAYTKDAYAANVSNAYTVNAYTSNAYSSMEDYYQELISWGKRWLSLYCETTVTLQSSGELEGIAGRLIFGHELEKFAAEPYSRETVAAYSAGVRELETRMQRIHQKGSRPIAADGGMIPMEYLYRSFQFTDFEWFLVVMTFMIEADQQFERLFCLLQDDYDKKMPSIELCIRMYTLDKKTWCRLQEQIIKRWELLSCIFKQLEEIYTQNQSTGSIFSTLLKLDERIISYIYHPQSKDFELMKLVKYYTPESSMQPLLVREREPENVSRIMETARGAFFYLSGAKGSGKKLLIRHACRQMKKRLLLVDISNLSLEDYTAKRFMMRMQREALLMEKAVICFHDIDLQDGVQKKLVERILNESKGYALQLVFTAKEAWDLRTDTGGRRCIELTVEPLTMEERETLWRGWLQADENMSGVSFERLADRYRLTPAAIFQAIEEVKNQQFIKGEIKDYQKALYKACQKQMIHKLGDDAVRIKAQYSMEDLILPRSQKRLLINACDLVEYRHLVYHKWGFDRKLAYGRGVSIIFYGPSGTGKTMGAQAMAEELGLELFRVDMSSVLSKYVGESEKKLGNIFEQGQKSQSILFFDEADALFGKRSEVKDAQDKYANAGTAYLLQRIEDYEGIIILATNLLQNFDTAFSRRFQFIIEFPMPDQKNRLQIWKKIFPEGLPVEEELDFEYLAEQFVFSGSQIKNIAVAAAFLAAGEQKKLNMFYILEAMKRELKKSGKNMIGTDFGKYQSLME